MVAVLIPNDAVAIGIGAFCGAFARHQCGKVATEWIASDPNKLARFQGWHTAAINIGGSFVLGGVSSLPTPSMKGANSSFFTISPRTKLLLGVGLCGSFTTFSTYSVDIVTMFTQGKTMKALSYVMANNVGGVAAAAVGITLVKTLFGK